MITNADDTAHRSGSRPRWLLPAIAAAAVAAALLYLGVLTPESLLTIGLFGGMIGMHLFGHGAHGDHGGHAGHAGENASADPGQAPVSEVDAPTKHSGGCH